VTGVKAFLLAGVKPVVVRDVANGFDAHLHQFLNRACLDSWQVSDVVIGARRIASVVELACDGIGTMGTHWYWRRLRKSQYSKFRPKQESELGQQPLDSSSQIPDLEESSRIDGAAVKNVVSMFRLMWAKEEEAKSSPDRETTRC
jgi:hypothetical protein